MKFGHTVSPEDQKRISCADPECGKPATVCLYGERVGFYYHCDEHTRVALKGTK